MPGRTLIAIDFGRRRFRAVEASMDRARLKVRRALVEPVPPDLDPDDAKAVGAWAGRQLATAGIARGKAVLAIPREHVVMKRLALPTSDPRELPEMTRLALQRELPFDVGDAVIDFVCLTRGDTSTTVMAVAAPRPVIDAARQAARSAGLGVDRISLRSMGSAALLGSLDSGGAGVLAVDITPERVEFSIVVDGAIRFSRAGELPAEDDHRAVADAVVTEARRTWMSYRIVDDTDDVRRAVVIGDRRVGKLVAGSIGEILKVETGVFDDHLLVEPDRDDLDEVWPLAGLLLAPGTGAELIDLNHPRKAPDRAARRRQLIMGGAGLAAVLVLGGMTLARLQLADLEQAVESLESQRDTQFPKYLRYGRDRYKLAHLEGWESADADWMEHIAYIVGLAPPPDRLVFDSCTGTVAFGGVKFDRKGKRFTAAKQIRIVLEGEAADRATADAFREMLVDTQVYEISTAGPDAKGGKRLPFAFQYHLHTSQSVPRSGTPVETQAAGGMASRERDE